MLTLTAELALFLLICALLLFAARILGARRAAEHALEESTERVRKSFDNAAIGMALVATDGSWLDVNPALCRLVGYDRDELLGLTFQELTHPEDLEADLEEAQRLLAGEIETYDREKRYFHKSGTVVWVLLNVSVVRDPEGRPLYFVSQIQDVTDRREAEEHVRALNHHLEERVVLRTTQLAERERQLEELVGKLLDAQEEERRRVAYEVHDGPTQLVIATHQHLQAFAAAHPPGARITPGTLDRPLELAQTAVKEARRIIEGLRPTALDDFGLASALRLLIEELKTEGFDAGFEQTLGDERLSPELETALYRVAQEALSNVRKHAETHRAHLHLTRTGRTVRLTVRDWGRGFVVSGGHGPRGAGERVGLSGMRERISLLGGTLVITSRPGSGTRLMAELPVGEEEHIDPARNGNATRRKTP